MDDNGIMVIITNPARSGHALKGLVLSNHDGVLHHAAGDEDASLPDGATTIVHIPPGGRLVIRDGSDPDLAAEMAANPDVIGHKPHHGGHHHHDPHPGDHADDDTEDSKGRRRPKP